MVMTWESRPAIMMLTPDLEPWASLAVAAIAPGLENQSRYLYEARRIWR